MWKAVDPLAQDLKNTLRHRRMICSLQLVLLLTILSTISWASGGMALNVLVGSDLMDPVMATQYLNVSTGFYLVMQPDCNLILYNGSQPLMSTNTSCEPGTMQANSTLTMDTDGYLSINELVLGPGSNVSPITTPIWSYYWDTGTPPPLYPYMILRGNGSCDFYDFNGNQLLSDYPLLTPCFPLGLTAPSPAPLSSNASGGSSVIPNIAYPFPPKLAWKPETSLDGFPYMPAEYFLSEGSTLQTVDQGLVLTLGSDCNLQSKEILANGSDRVVWESRTNSSEIRNCQLMLQQDGRLQIRNNVSGAVYWNSTLAGNVSVSWMLRLGIENGGLSISDIEDPSTVLWSSFDLNQAKSASQASSKWNRTTTWIVVHGVIGGASVLATAGLALLYYYARASILKPVKDYRRRIQSNVGKSQTLYSQSKVREATNNFGKKIGYGGFGDVFYGKLADGQEVAAKVLSTNSLQSNQEFYNEIELLSVVHHKYLVSLLGYSCTRKHQILIYEYMGGGDLKHRLQGEGAAKNPLSWRQRTSITLQVAEGLEYLHDKCSPAIIHRDVKSNNILLTNKLVAKVADFGLSKLRTLDQEDATHITTVVKGTPGYLDPEYHETGMLTEKSDVYAYGIVLMEILTGRPQMSLIQTVSEAHKSEQFDDLVDSNLGSDYDRDEFVKLVELSLWCVRKSNVERPFMRQIVQRLREIGLAPLQSLQREGSSVYKSIQDIDLGNKEQVPRGSGPLCGSSSSCNMTTEKSCDSRVCQIDHSTLKRPITKWTRHVK